MKNFVTAQSSGVGRIARRASACQTERVEGPHVHTQEPTRRANAVWNYFEFTCRSCGRHWLPNTIRICRLGGQMVCQRCRDAALSRAVPNPGKKVATDPDTLCHTCKAPMGRRRAVMNVLGQTVHYRCPKKKN